MTDIEHPFVVPRIVIEDYGDSQGPKEELETSNLKLNQDWKKNGRSQATARTMASKVGWRQVTGIDDPLPPEGEERDKVVLNLFLAEQYYLAKCRDAGVIIIVRYSACYLEGEPERSIALLGRSYPHEVQLQLGMVNYRAGDHKHLL